MGNAHTLIMTILRRLRRHARAMWVRVAMMGLLAFVTVALSQMIEPFVPESLAQSVGEVLQTD
jgi:hypothetical protein